MAVERIRSGDQHSRYFASNAARTRTAIRPSLREGRRDEPRLWRVESAGTSRSRFSLATLEDQDPNVRLYLRDIRRIPQLAKGEEEALSARVRRPKSQEDARAARNRLVEGCYFLALNMALQRMTTPSSAMDLIQEANQGLLDAAERYDATRAAFTTYAVWHIKQRLNRWKQTKSRSIHIPVHVWEASARVMRYQTDFYEECKRYPTSAETALACGVSEEVVEGVNDLSRPPLSLQERLYAHEDNEGEDVGDVIADPRVEADFDAVHVHAFFSRVWRVAEEALDDRARAVLALRFGLVRLDPMVELSALPAVTEDRNAGTGFGGYSLRETAALLDICHERVRQLQWRALSALRAACLKAGFEERDIRSLEALDEWREEEEDESEREQGGAGERAPDVDHTRPDAVQMALVER